MHVSEMLSGTIPSERLRCDEGLDRHSTYRVGGPADVMCLPRTRSELLDVVTAASVRGIPWLVVGNGSNILFSDDGFRGLVIKIRGAVPVEGTLWHLAQEGDFIRAGAGVSLPRLARSAAAAGLSGLEFCTGIPGVVGGSIRGNAGAHGSDLGAVVESVEMIRPSGDIVTIRASQAGFSYRESEIEPDGIVTGAVFRLTPDEPENVHERIRVFTEYRKRTQPSSDQSAGCMFKNPVGDSAGRLIDAAGCKGLQVGGSRVSEIHGNFVINQGGATASDALRLIDLVRERVFARTGVALALEVRVMKSGVV
ncbi:MAG: UDP-N-acetylmuramate dehydrogenase [Gemmatimonadetes bacterium]|nr:UDP-N-acetylmuramate dehydrogenase [Gemmatimonadota bacterium]